MADWKTSLEKFVHKVEQKVDAQRQKYAPGSGAARIDAYRGYGCADRAYLKGRVLRGNPIPASEEGAGVLMNVANMIQRFESDEVPGTRVRIEHPGGPTVVTSAVSLTDADTNDVTVSVSGGGDLTVATVDAGVLGDAFLRSLSGTLYDDDDNATEVRADFLSVIDRPRVPLCAVAGGGCGRRRLHSGTRVIRGGSE